MRVLCLMLTLWASSAHATEFFVHWTEAALKEMDRVTAKYWPDQKVKASTGEEYQFVKLEMGLTLGKGKFQECLHLYPGKESCGFNVSRPHVNLEKNAIQSGDTFIHPNTPLLWQDSDQNTTKIKFKPLGPKHADTDCPEYYRYAFPDAPGALGEFWQSFLKNPRLEFKLTYNKAIAAEDQFQMPLPTTLHYNATDFPERSDIAIANPRIRQDDLVVQIDFDDTGFHFMPFTNKNPTAKTTEPSGDFYIAVSRAARNKMNKIRCDYHCSLWQPERSVEEVKALETEPLFNLKVQVDEEQGDFFSIENLCPENAFKINTLVPCVKINNHCCCSGDNGMPYRFYKISVEVNHKDKKWVKALAEHEWNKRSKFFFKMDCLAEAKPHLTCALPDKLGVRFTQDNFSLDPDFETYSAYLDKGDMVLLLDYNDSEDGRFTFRTFSVAK